MRLMPIYLINKNGVNVKLDSGKISWFLFELILNKDKFSGVYKENWRVLLLRIICWRIKVSSGCLIWDCIGGQGWGFRDEEESKGKENEGMIQIKCMHIK